ncbi:hypothetical protein CASFOL_003705 [Castilleja foliolosa]|uniref:C2 domain-containing protein n=1 Tax=Castilleja foliolosa TaxID=1961234 RepID=A0ABD3ELB4_9LAMI
MSRVPYQLLELNIISAQDLSPVSKNLRTYAVTWINPDRKLRTLIDQDGQTNPTWNDKFVFRVDNKLLDSETSSVMIEIYAQGWLRDAPVGSVSVLISNLIPPPVREEISSRRFVALQIRRPSGRPQGILNMGVSLLDNTMRSMPLFPENVDNGKKNEIQLFRSLSDKTDLTSKQGGGKKIKGTGSICNGSLGYQGGSAVNGGGSAVNGGSMVNGSVCNSDVGPSPSVVAAAVAIGLYPTHLGPPPKPGSSVLEDWAVEDQSSMEGLKSKIERWRMVEIPQVYDQRYERLENGKRREKKRNRRRRKSVPAGGDGDGTGLFRCFGLGCEFTIVCGGDNKRGGKKNRARGRRYTSSKASVSEVGS